MKTLAFEPLYYADRLHNVNPHGDVAVITLWSPVQTVLRKFDQIDAALLDPAQSRIAVIANLYGDGMPAMFCNLLFNPQIRHLAAVGEDLGQPTCDEIESFIRVGLDDDEMLGSPVKRISGTNRIVPALPELEDVELRNRLTFRRFGKLSQTDFSESLTAYLAGLPEPKAVSEDARIRAELPTDAGQDYAFQPSNHLAHEVIRTTPLECWRELIVRGARFGRPVTLRNGPRLELVNVKAVVTEPRIESVRSLSTYGFDLDRFTKYRERILTSTLPEGIGYTYGNRLRGYFEQGEESTDTLETVISRLRANPETRHAYIAVWDTANDLPVDGESSRPCLTTVWFRRAEGKLTLTATFRAHNLLSAWMENFYGLMVIQDHVAKEIGSETGPITILSHSLGIDPRDPRYALAQSIEEGWNADDSLDPESGKFSLREDPNGYFAVSVDHEGGRIVAEHRFETALIKRYESDSASRLQREISADMAVSLVSHALWLGGELRAKEQLLQAGKERVDG